MNNRHLPAGQALPPPPPPLGGVGAAQPGMDIGGRIGPVHGPGGRRDRRHPLYQSQYHHQAPHQQHPGLPMYPNYMNPYAANAYVYPPMPPYQNSGMPPASYMPPYHHQPYGARSPPAMPQYAPLVSMGMPPPQQFSRQAQHSPIVVSTPYQAPPPVLNQMPAPAPAPLPVQLPPLSAPHIPLTPSSTHSSHTVPPPSPPPAVQPVEAVQQPIDPQPQVQVVPAQPETPAEPFRPPLPWLSRADQPWPQRNGKSRRRRRILAVNTGSVELPATLQGAVMEYVQPSVSETSKTSTSAPAQEQAPRSITPSTPGHPSEYAASTSPTTPNSVQPSSTNATTTPKSAKTPRAAIPAVPVIPILPKMVSTEAKSASSARDEKEVTSPLGQQQTTEETASQGASDAQDQAGSESKPAMAAPAAPKLWTGLFTKSASPATAAGAGAPGHAGPNGTAVTDGPATNGAASTGGFSQSNAVSLAEAIRAYRVGGADKIAFLEPRGLINTGNMCYMNSVLQVLIFCIPFYEFLDQASHKAKHSFKSETPLVDAMIMFVREFKAIDSAHSVEQLRRRLKVEELEQYGVPFTPEFVYDAIRKLSRFASMRRGHQQDAEEFLGFVLQSLDDECAHIMRTAPASAESTAPNSTRTTRAPSVSSVLDEGTDDWLEVGRRQRPAVTRSSGHSSTTTPVTKIFGGQLRSELRVPGLKDSVTLEPYQPLQLDIGGPQTLNIVDALKGLTRPETLHGDFNSPRGKNVTATKQVFIESLPPVLILHLKRFQFDAEGNGTVKIWKKIGYPLELEIPREVFSRQKRNSVLAEGAGLPRYRLTAVVYHHGKNASGGHYTVDVRRQDGREWIRLDDTNIRRVRSEDVAEGGAEEKPSKIAASTAADNSGKKDGGSTPTGANRFAAVDDEAGDEDEWKEVSAPVNGGKKWSSVVNGSASSSAKGKQVKDSIKDNKVAYILFYQRI